MSTPTTLTHPDYPGFALHVAVDQGHIYNGYVNNVTLSQQYTKEGDISEVLITYNEEHEVKDVLLEYDCTTSATVRWFRCDSFSEVKDFMLTASHFARALGYPIAGDVIAAFVK